MAFSPFNEWNTLQRSSRVCEWPACLNKAEWPPAAPPPSVSRDTHRRLRSNNNSSQGFSGFFEAKFKRLIVSRLRETRLISSQSAERAFPSRLRLLSGNVLLNLLRDTRPTDGERAQIRPPPLRHHGDGCGRLLQAHAVE